MGFAGAKAVPRKAPAVGPADGGAAWKSAKSSSTTSKDTVQHTFKQIRTKTLTVRSRSHRGQRFGGCCSRRSGYGGGEIVVEVQEVGRRFRSLCFGEWSRSGRVSGVASAGCR